MDDISKNPTVFNLPSQAESGHGLDADVDPVFSAAGAADEWVFRGLFLVNSCEFTHDPFPIDPHFLEATTKYAADNHLDAIIRFEVKLGLGQTRLTQIFIGCRAVAA